MKMMTGVLLAMALFAPPANLAAQQNTADKPTALLKNLCFLNGQWFNGKTFAPQTFYSVRGLLTRHKPMIVDATVDLHNGYVVPPFGDAHCHYFDEASDVEGRTRQYLNDGIFYAKVLTDRLSGARAVAGKVNIPAGVDVFYAHGGLTGDNSHPIPIYEALDLGYYNGKDMEAHKEEILKSRRRENDAYYIVNTPADLEQKWTKILAGKPDFLKVYLLHSEDYAKRKAKQGYGEGLDPQLLPEIIARAHAAGLTVSAHVDSASDYRAALKAGVDEMAHLPGYYIGIKEDLLAYTLTPEDAKETARRGVHVTPTASVTEYTSNPDERRRTEANQARNLETLKEAGVQFGIGADTYGADALKEALYLSKLGIWNNLEMLKMWCETTPRAIFRSRKIGYLRDGYEASFVVLEADPLAGFDNVTQISLRCKQGNVLQMPVQPVPSSAPSSAQTSVQASVQSSALPSAQSSSQPSSQPSSQKAAQTLLEEVAATMSATRTLTARYETRRRFLDPYEEIREEGTVRLARPNLVMREGWTLLPAQPSGKWERVGKAAAVVSDGQNAYALTPLPNGLQYRRTKADAYGKNVAFDLPPLSDFFDPANSFARQVVQARADNTLEDLRLAGTEDCDGAKCQVVEFTITSVKNNAPYRCRTRLAVDADRHIRHCTVGVKQGDLAAEQEFFLRAIRANESIYNESVRAEEFAVHLPPNATPYAPPPTLLANGVTAPDFTLQDTNGKPIRLSDYKGKTVLLDFWATWCVPCLKSFPNTLATLEKYKAKNVVVIAVNVLDSRQNFAQYVAAHPEYAAFTFATDAPKASASIASLYHISNIPLVYVIAPDGKITTSLEGYTGSQTELEAALQSIPHPAN